MDRCIMMLPITDKEWIESMEDTTYFVEAYFQMWLQAANRSQLIIKGILFFPKKINAAFAVTLPMDVESQKEIG